MLPFEIIVLIIGAIGFIYLLLKAFTDEDAIEEPIIQTSQQKVSKLKLPKQTNNTSVEDMILYDITNPDNTYDIGKIDL